MSKHTPTPWEVDSALCGDHDTETLSIYHSPGPQEIDEVIETGCKCGDECMSIEDAHHIVKCVNYHDRLVEALDKAVSHMKSAGVLIESEFGSNRDIEEMREDGDLPDEITGAENLLAELSAHNGGEG